MLVKISSCQHVPRQALRKKRRCTLPHRGPRLGDWPTVDGPADHTDTYKMETTVTKDLVLYVGKPFFRRTLFGSSYLFVMWIFEVLEWFVGVAVGNWQQFLFLPLTTLARLVLIWLDAWLLLEDGSRAFFFLLVAPLMMYLYIIAFMLWIRVVAWFAARFWTLLGRRTVLGWSLELALAWWYRGATAPPAVQPAEVVNDPTVPGLALAHMRGTFYAQAAQVRHASLTAGGFTASRLRRRSRWVGALQEYLGGRPGSVGELINGRWTPDLPSDRRALSANAFLCTFDGEVKLLGGGVVPSDDPAVHEPYLVVQTRTGREVVVPSLLGRLTRYSCFRDRNPALLSGLRSRAQEWCADKRVADCVLPLIIPSACAMAYLVSAPERFALDRILAEEGHTTHGA